ncbi:PREDICTED: rho GTPase-activating protein 21-like, partial [Nicrophorus vespilloides]|uniref:Rho GTPase-activating protein 21-like n=1 Tax=Nicrophorus vespilloides TaxID=110193 RepID=A0ABM1MZK3_NICVS
MADDGEYSKTFLQSQETFQRAPEAQAEHRFPARASGVVEVPLGSRGPRSLYLRRNGDTFGFTLRHFIIYPPESLTETDGRHAAVGALLTPMDTIFVKEVAERGPAKQAGLHRGDRILYVNGESVSNLTYSELVHKIQTSPTYLHLLVVPKEEDILQKYFADTAHNPLSNKLKEDRRRTIQQPQGGFQVDAVSWRSLQNPSYSSIDYGRYVPQRQLVVDNSTDSIYSYGVPERSSENIYSTPRDTFRPNDRKSLEIYAEPVINDSTQRPRAQPQVPLYRKMGRRASEGSSTAVSETEYSLSCEDIDTTMKSSKAPYTSTDTFNSLEMPALMYSNVVGCRLSLDAGNRRESTSSLHSYESSSTLAGQDTDTDSIVMSRLRKSVQEKEEFMRRSSRPSELIQREFYSRPKKLEKPVWPPIDPQESPSRLNKPTHHNFQRVKNDIDNEREIIHNLDNKRSNTAEFLGKIQENENGQTNGTNASDTEDRRNYPPNIQMVSKRARQFESGRLMTEDDPIMNDRTSFYRSELARLSAKKAVPNVAVRTREFETMSSENFPRRDTSSSSTNSASVLRRSYRDSRSLDSSGSNCSLSSSAAEISKPFPGNFSIPIGSKFIHCPLPSDYKPTQDLPSNANQSNRMRQRSNSTGSCVAHMHTETSADTNNSYSSDSATTTGRAESLDTKQSPFLAEPYFNLIPESVEQLHRTPCVSVTPPSPIPQPKSLQTSAVRPNQLDLGAPKRPLRHLRAPQTVAADTPPPVQSVCNDKPLVVRRIKNTNITDEDRVTRRESYLRATEGGRIMSLESRDFSDGDVSPQVLRSAHRRWRPPLFLGDIQQLRKLFEEPSTSPSGGSLSGGSSSSVSLEREKITSCVLPVEKEKAYFVKEGLLHCKITEIDGKRFGDRSWKQVWAVLKGPKLFLYKDRHHL